MCSIFKYTIYGLSLYCKTMLQVSTYLDVHFEIYLEIHFHCSPHIVFFYKILKIFILFIIIYFWLHWVFVAVCGLSLVAASGGYSLLWCAGFSLRWLLLRSTGSRCAGFSSCGSWAQQLWLTGSRAQAQQLWRMSLVALWHVRSSWTRARTHIPCIDRRILNHCATRETPHSLIKSLQQPMAKYRNKDTIYILGFDQKNRNYCQVF